MLTELAVLTSQIAVATLFGSMAFFTGVIAPLVFTKLEADVAGRFIRALFPWYYLVIIGCSVLATAALAVHDPTGALIMGLVAAGGLVSRQILMPLINRHRDRALAGDATADRWFARLHRLTVLINLLQIIASLIVLIRLA